MEELNDLTASKEKREPANQENLKIDAAELAEIKPEEKKENAGVLAAAEKSEEVALSQIRNKIEKIEGDGRSREVTGTQKIEVLEEEKDYMGHSMTPEKYEKAAEELSGKGDHEAAANNYQIAADLFGRIMYPDGDFVNPKIEEWDKKRKEMWRKYAEEYQRTGNFKGYIINTQTF